MQGKYLKAVANGLLDQRIVEGQKILGSCDLCPRECRVNRMDDERGFCRIGRLAEVASYGPHFGEESVLVGSGGSGTIFFCGCNLLCRFCQNYQLSQRTDPGCLPVTAEHLAQLMVELQEMGCHNINLVTPTHVVPQLLAALPIAVEAGLRLPLVYNCGGYEKVEALRLLDGIVDIYLPDVKFWRRESARRHAAAPDYRKRMTAALKEMQRQVGDLRVDARGLAEGGLLVRHLLMPGGLEEAKEIFAFLAEQLSVDCYLNIMDQYRPCGEFIDRNEEPASIDAETYRKACQAARQAGLRRLDERDWAALLRRLRPR